MSAMPSPVQADFPSTSLPIRGPLDSTLHHHSDLDDDDPFSGDGERGLGRAPRRGSSSGITLAVMFFAGVALTAAWYSYGGSVREAVANLSPQLAWVAPQPAPAAEPAVDPAAAAAPAGPSLDQQLSAASQDIDAVRQNVDRITETQDRIIRSIDQLSAGQEQLTKEIAKLQAVEQYILYKNSEAPTPRPAPVRRAPMPLTPPANPR